MQLTQFSGKEGHPFALSSSPPSCHCVHHHTVRHTSSCMGRGQEALVQHSKTCMHTQQNYENLLLGKAVAYVLYKTCIRHCRQYTQVYCACGGYAVENLLTQSRYVV